MMKKSTLSLMALGAAVMVGDLLPGGIVARDHTARDASPERANTVGFQPEASRNGASGAADGDVASKGLSFREAKEQLVGDFERRFLLDALRRNGGNITRAAEEVGMYRQSFQQKMRELGITSDDAA